MNRLNQRIDLFATFCGVFGALVALVALIMRVVAGPGNPPIKIAPRSLLLAAVALMVFACFLKLTNRRED